MPRITIGFFSLEVERSWGLSTVILSGPTIEQPGDPRLPAAPRPFQSNIVVTTEAVTPEETARSYVEKQIAALRNAGIDYREGAPPEEVVLTAGGTGWLTEQIVVGADGAWVRQMQLVAVTGGIACTLIASQLDGPPFEKGRGEFRRMLLSFHYEGADATQ